MLDPAALNALRELQFDDEPDVVEEVVTTFLKANPARLAQLKQAHLSRNRQELSRVAHAMKSGSATLGASALHRCCAQLEEEADRPSCQLDYPETAFVFGSGMPIDQFLRAIDRNEIWPPYLAKPYSPGECSQMLEGILKYRTDR